MSRTREERLRSALEINLTPVALQIVDQSHLHAGHEGAIDGRGHFKIRIVSNVFEGVSRTARHQLVYRAVGEMMNTDIHALSINALTPSEAALSQR